jgi:hypothetical protein
VNAESMANGVYANGVYTRKVKVKELETFVARWHRRSV